MTEFPSTCQRRPRGLVALILALAAWLPFAAAGAEPARWLEPWLAAQTNCQTWAAELVQTRTFRTLNQPLTATGRVWFAAPDRFRWELGQPATTIAVRQPDQLLVSYPRLRRVERYPLTGSERGPWKETLSLLEAGFPRSRAELDARYRVLDQRVTNDTCALVLEPKAGAARRLLPRLEVVFATNDFDLRATALQFADGSTLRNDFRHTRRNGPVTTNLFTLPLEPGQQLVEPLRPPAKP